MVDDLKQGGEELEHETPKAKGPFAEREEVVLEFWNREKIFEKSLEQPAPKGEYIFYDGPPFANGLPHYGHILASTIKDAIPRYRTMAGYHVARRWGWDCHGLPVENLVERELGFKGKRDIEEYGVGNFNERARTSIMQDVSDWRRIIPRIGRWADMEHDYKTMDSSYTESVWWAFKKLYNKGLVYEGFKAMQLCPRCGTTLSNFEVAQGYQDITDISVYVKFPLVDEQNTSLLIWTTTPWTLPGNTAAAVNADAEYAKVRVLGEATIQKAGTGTYPVHGQEYIYIAKSILEKFEQHQAGFYLFPNSQKNLKVETIIKGKDLVGKRYEPPFDYFKEELHKHKTHAWRVYAAPFVTLESGTGIVHIAPAFGEDDLALAQKEKIPLIHHVTEEGKFIATVADFAHLPVKPKGHHTDTDTKIVEYLRVHSRLFAEEKILHSYPHCWRCDTPLLNWAANSWFVAVSKLKKKLLAQNNKVSWVPEHLGEGRFANGLESAPDWAVSRSRFWGAPLPVWRHSKNKEIKVAGSINELLSMVRRSGNRYFLVRHGEAHSNIGERLDCKGDPENHLTEKGRHDVLRSAQELRKQHIDLIIASPLLRTQETAHILQKELGLPGNAVMTDERLRETNFGVLDGKSRGEWDSFFVSFGQKFAKAPEGGETYLDVRRRVGEFLFDVEQRYTNKNILIVGHGNPLWLLEKVARRASSEELMQAPEKRRYLHKAAWEELPFTPYPHNGDYELDLHRPYIDELPMGDALNGRWERAQGVFDCWFESGAMPFANNHYPFIKNVFNPRRLFGLAPKSYPADFIAEGLDQTRGWFYSLIVLGTALFGKSPYKHVIVNGLINASDGKKMSKRLKNYPDPMEVVEQYGADALRYYLLSSPVVRAEDLRFNLRGVEEVQKKLLMRLDNVRSFYDLYMSAAGESFPKDVLSPQILDKWIFSRLGQLIQETTRGFEKHELDAAARPLAEFIDDLSTWYLRRSRDRFKEEGSDKKQARATLRAVLMSVAQIMAPIMPFYADDLYRRLRSESDPVSVHLTHWPAAPAVDEQLLRDMQKIRILASQGLELREKAGIKVRQPLARFSVPSAPESAELRAILADELNVKEIVEDTNIKDAILDTELTLELKEEGTVRELVRRVQDWRKKQGLTIADRPDHTLVVDGEEMRVAEKYKEHIIEATGLRSLGIQSE